jgi:hypothetical protein
MKKGVLTVALAILLSACATKNRDSGGTTAAQTGTNQFLSTRGATNRVPPATPADNTAQNRRDQTGETLTPFDQGSSQADRNITQDIRRALTTGPEKDQFSFTAKNVKIISVNGRVTLRGVVKNENEREAITALAKGTLGVQQVDDQLEVAH